MTKEDLKKAWYAGDKEAPLCVNCRYFHKHYIRYPWKEKDSAPYVEIDYGHCSYPRIKQKRQWDSCDHFEKAQT